MFGNRNGGKNKTYALAKIKHANMILQYPDSECLTKVSEEVVFPLTDKDISAIKTLKFWERENPASRGLSACQIGYSKRIAVIKYKGSMITIINPEIIDSVGESLSNEGCHSLNEARYIISRPKKGHVRWFDEDGKEHTVFCRFDDMRLFCHEIDHMNGLLIQRGEPFNANIVHTSKN